MTVTSTALTGPDESPAAGPRLLAGARSGAVIALRVGSFSARIHTRSVLVSIVLAAVLGFGAALSISIGDSNIPLGHVVGELTGLGGDDSSEFVIRTLRLPRVLTAVLVGAAFGISGQIFQRMVRNPLASPDILGVSSGAAAGAVWCIVLFSAASSTVTGAALFGSAAAVAAIYLLAIKEGLSSYRLVLVGIGMTAMLNAVVAYLLTKADLYDAQRAMIWLTGSLNGRSWEYVRPLTAVLVVLVPVSLIATRQLRVLELGDDAAHGLGVDLRRAKLTLAMVGAALAAVGTAAAGPVGFLALVSPQIARRLVGARSVALVPSALVGATILVYSDLLARRMFAPVELPVGVVTAVVGAPYLLWLLARANKIGIGG